MKKRGFIEGVSIRLSPGMMLRLGAIGLALLLALYLVFSEDSGILQIHRLRNERDHLRNQVQQLQAEKDELQQQIENLKNADPFVIEEEARRKGMTRDGEEIYRLHYEVTPDSVSNRSDQAPQGH